MSDRIPEGRLPGLDVARAWMMLLGIIVHGTAFSLFHIKAHYWLATVGLVSGLFRMEAFFAISGLLAAKVIAKTPKREWLSKRATSLLVPFLFGVLVVNPIGYILSNLLQQRPALTAVRLDIGHMWFLLTLFVCCATISVLDGRVKLFDLRKDAFQKAKTPPWAAYIAFSALGFILIVLYNYGMSLSKYSVSVHRLFARLLHDLMYTVGQAPHYLIFFAFGYLLVKSPQFCRDMLSGYKIKIFSLLLGVALIAIICLNYGVAMLQEYELLAERNSNIDGWS